jgi:hypothetical protein
MAARRPVELRIDKPRTRADCVAGPRPCPWTACRHHLGPASQSCALDVADAGDHTLAEVGELLHVTREWVRQLELSGLRKMREAAALLSKDED